MVTLPKKFTSKVSDSQRGQMACFCTASELKMGFTFLKDGRKIEQGNTKLKMKKRCKTVTWPAKLKHLVSGLLQKFADLCSTGKSDRS